MARPSDHRIELAPGLWTVIMAFVGEAAVGGSEVLGN